MLVAAVFLFLHSRILEFRPKFKVHSGLQIKILFYRMNFVDL